MLAEHHLRLLQYVVINQAAAKAAIHPQHVASGGYNNTPNGDQWTERCIVHLTTVCRTHELTARTLPDLDAHRPIFATCGKVVSAFADFWDAGFFRCGVSARLQRK